MTPIGSHSESVGSHAWSAADEQFFRITAELFDPGYLLGATVLLASYDDSVAYAPTTFLPLRGAPPSGTAQQAAASAA